MADTHGYSEEAMVSIGVAAAITGYHPNTLRRWDTTGWLRVYRTLGGRRRYRVADLHALRLTESQTTAESGISAPTGARTVA